MGDSFRYVLIVAVLIMAAKIWVFSRQCVKRET